MSKLFHKKAVFQSLKLYQLFISLLFCIFEYNVHIYIRIYCINNKHNSIVCGQSQKAIDRISHMGANGFNEVISLGSLTKPRFNIGMSCHFGTSEFII